MNPISITNKNTTALSQTFLDRLKGINLRQILISIETETNLDKLEYWLQMFGIKTRNMDFTNMTEIQKRTFLISIIKTIRSVGTENSVIELCKAIGADEVKISKNWILRHNAQAKYDGLFLYNEGVEYQQFCITISVKIKSDFNIFKEQFNIFFNQFEPVRIFINEIKKYD